MTTGTVRVLLARACGELGWIAEPAVCQDLRRRLGASGDEGLKAFLDTLEAQHGPGKPVNDNAYWLLKVNAEFVLAHK